MSRILVNNLSPTSVGHQTDNLCTVVSVSVADILSEFGGNGSWSVFVKRPGEESPYPLLREQYVVLPDGVMNVIFSSTELAKAGRGQFQIRYSIGSVVKNTRIYDFICKNSLDGSEEPPAPWISYIQEVEANANRAEAAVEHYPKISEISGNWVIWDAINEEWHDTGIHAQGEKGDTGTSLWEDILNKPETFPPSPHNHDDQYYTKAQTDSAIAMSVDLKVDKEDGKGLSTNDYSNADKSKLAGIQNGAEVNVQADWEQDGSMLDDYIKNKPTAITIAEIEEMFNGL